MISTQSMLAQMEKPSVFTCLNCRVKFDSTDAQKTHFKSDWHKYNLKRKVCNLPAIDLKSFEIIQTSLPVEKKPETKPIPTPNDKIDQESRPSTSRHSKQMESEDDDEDEDGDWEEVDDEEEDEEQIAEMLSRVVKPNTCLFCAKKSTDLKRNLVHMNRMHGFFIPEEQYLIDVEGLMEYLGFKVGAGATCLWCNKEFSTVHGVRLHMLYKDHCKILYDQDKAIDEFKEFYDYADQEKIEMKPLNQLAISKRATERGYWRDMQVVRSDRSHAADSKQLVVRQGLSFMVEPKLAKNYKKFAAIRAKTRLHIGMTNNNTMRSRIRLQNPM